MSMSFQEQLCDCCKDPLSCIVVCCFSHLGALVIQALAVDKATQQGVVVPYLLGCCLLCIGNAINRTKIRERYGIQGSCFGDCCTWFFCCFCAACQEFREVKVRSTQGGPATQFLR